MLAACESGDAFALLEGPGGGETLASVFACVREPWLVRALLAYHERTGSARALELLAGAPEPHAKHAADVLHEQLRAPSARARRHALAALAPLAARRPAWLHRLVPLARAAAAAARADRAPPPLVHALLALAALAPAAPAHLALPPLWPDLVHVLLLPAALLPPPPPAARLHLHLAQLALFQALYATHPCTLLDALRDEYERARDSRDALLRNLAPLLHSVCLHTGLVTGSRQRESDPARWSHVETHHVLDECRRLTHATPAAPARDRSEERAPSRPRAASGPPAPGSGGHASRSAGGLAPGHDAWFPLAERCGADSTPHTPLPADDAAEPEAAVEATPENTPAKETRTAFRFPTDSPAVRSIGRHSQPPSPLRKETSPPAAGEPPAGSRLARVAQERAAANPEGATGRRRAVDSPVPFAGAPPAALPRPEPRAPPPPPDDADDRDDREVLELTRAALPADGWPEGEAAPPAAPADPRRVLPPRRAAPAPASAPAPAPRRALSCPPGAPTATATVAVQTVDVWPEPYEFLIADFHRSLPDDTFKTTEDPNMESRSPSERLDAYLGRLYSGREASDGGEAGEGGEGGEAGGELAEQLALVHAQLMYERWRREVHAERNRRLLGRCRQVRAIELHNATLRDQLRALTRERDELRARRARDRPAPLAPHPTAALEAQLAGERAARARAEAALQESEAQRRLDGAELQRMRAQSAEAERHRCARQRAEQAAARHEEDARRLRRELLLLAEREARLRTAVSAAVGRTPAGGGAAQSAGVRAARERERAAVVRAEGEAAAAAARARELEAQLAARDAVVGEMKRVVRAAGEEHAARLAALHDKYQTLLRVVRTQEARRLERLAGAPPAAPRAAPAPAAAPPRLQDVSRAHLLLELEDDE